MIRGSLLAIVFMSAGVAMAQGQADTSIKAETTYKHSDAQMTVAYREAQAAMKTLDAQNRTRGGGFGFAAALLNAQRAWIDLRDRQCSIEDAIYEGGSMGPLVSVECKTRLTLSRTRDLRSLLADTKGGS